MKEIVWVCGASASGKETFIKNVLRDKDLQAKFGWESKVVQACQSSIEHIGQFENDPVVNERESIIREAQQLLRDADVILIKWQFVDSEAGRVMRLNDLVPDAAHKIIRLETPESELVKRLKYKTWWHDDGNEKEFIAQELKEVDKAISKLSADFEVINVSSDGYRYDKVKS